MIGAWFRKTSVHPTLSGVSRSSVPLLSSVRLLSSGRLLFLLGGFVALACGMSATSAESDKGTQGDDGAGDGDEDGVDSTPVPMDPDLPEQELEESFRAPVVSGTYLFSVNPDSNKVARINAETLDIDVLEGGNGPTFLATIPAGATAGGAAVINTRSHDVSLFFSDGDDSPPEATRVPVQKGASALEVGALGRFIVVWSRSEDGTLNSADGYQDLTVIDLAGKSPKVRPLSVGFRPSKVFINADETYAYVVSGPGISVIDLENGPQVIRELFLAEDNVETGRDVSFSMDGAFAFVRRGGSSEILVVDTETGDEAVVSLPGPVTDLDLSADGLMAIAVVRGGQTLQVPPGGEGGAGPDSAESAIALLPTQTIFAHPDDFDLVFTDEIVGSAVVSPDASRVLLFTNAQPNSRLSILRTDNRTLRVVDLKAPVSAAFLSEDGADSVVLMLGQTGGTKAGAFALLPVSRVLPPRIEGTSTVPRFVSISGQAGRALITTEATQTARAVAYFGRLSEQSVDQVELPSVPLSSGMVPEAGQGFVSQSHAEGRVTFLNLTTGVHKTVTGFELASKVVE